MADSGAALTCMRLALRIQDALERHVLLVQRIQKVAAISPIGILPNHVVWSLLLNTNQKAIWKIAAKIIWDQRVHFIYLSVLKLFYFFNYKLFLNFCFIA